MTDLKKTINTAMAAAMKERAKEKLGVIRLILAAIKQKEIDERIELDDNQVINILTKMVKQRKESISQFMAADRLDLVAKENFEINIIKEFLPPELSETEIALAIDQALIINQATSIKDMAKVMQYLRKSLLGAVDLEKIGSIVKTRLIAK